VSDLRLLEIGMHFDPAGGGADRYFSGLLGGLQDIGANVTAAAFGTPGPEVRRATSLGPANAGLLQRLRAMSQLNGTLSEPGSVVASHFALYALPLAGHLRRGTHVVHFHGPWAGESAREGQNPLAVAAKRFVEQRVYSSAKRLITLSTAFRDLLCADYGIPASRVSVVPGGVDVERFRPAESRVAARAHLGWPEDRQIIFCIRRLVHRMGLENLIAAFGKIAPRYPKATLVIAGRGPLAADLKALADSLGLGEQIRFAGFVSDADLPLAYAAADFSIVPSDALEGFGLITLESLACGTPVLVTPIGGLPEAVSGLSSSLVLPGCSIADIAAGLERGLAGGLPSVAECRAYAENNFAWPAIARRVMTVYREAANDPVR
jgi:glycosyltransferase involved in cell wall biosynthesis